MKVLLFVLCMISVLLVLSGCFKTLDQLFTIPIEHGTYLYEEEEELIYLEKTITEISLLFTEVEEPDIKDDSTLFVDYAKDPKQYYQVTLRMSIDGGELKTYELAFQGKANPNEPNAYRTEFQSSEFTNKKSSYSLIIRPRATNDQTDELDYLYVTIYDYDGAYLRFNLVVAED